MATKRRRTVAEENRKTNTEWKDKPLFTSLKRRNIKRHFETSHGEKYSKYNIEEKRQLAKKLTKNLQQQVLTRSSEGGIANTIVSFDIAKILSKHQKPFSDGQIVKDSSDVSLSRCTIVTQVENMCSDIVYQLKVKLSDIESYSLALDESTDTRDTAHLAVFIRAVDKDFNVAEELLDLNLLKGTTRGVDIFEDGAPSMIGCHNGLIAKVREFKPDIIAVHCIIHQENLSTKLINMDHVNSVVVKTVNYIRSRGLNHREFQEVLKHLESQSEDVIYFTEVLWLSRVSTLQRFWLLLDEVILFLKLKQKEVQGLCDPLWRMDLADVQLYEQSVCEQKVDHFPNLKSVFNGNNEILDSYTQRVAVLRKEFSSRFTELRNLRSKMTVFSLPCTCEISSAAVQLELNVLQEDDILIQNFKEINLIDFYKSLPAADYCNLKRLFWKSSRWLVVLGVHPDIPQLAPVQKNLKF
ncbi:unnamed protein product [Lepeophtheirus salmonis]|uniref:(salmon louse) hypothetical protein n=1 Tax=Lepeophtheirus salmonis TaxID=72036 RepID=A0A7R8CVF1_LEPSM|nr:unnamed protein product [Lepeophtheirus salmonis]CAF2942838.1 unnamed protein product [Lepeophtheirus salmonis]